MAIDEAAPSCDIYVVSTSNTTTWRITTTNHQDVSKEVTIGSGFLEFRSMISVSHFSVIHNSFFSFFFFFTEYSATSYFITSFPCVELPMQFKFLSALSRWHLWLNAIGIIFSHYYLLGFRVALVCWGKEILDG